MKDGVTQCDKEEGRFVPPESSMDWVKVMLLLNPNDDEYPYPDPGVPNSGSTQYPITHNMGSNSFLYQKYIENPKAWVALKHVSGIGDENAPLAKDLRLGHSWMKGIFLMDSRSAARTAVGAGKYMTSEGVPENLNLPSLYSLSHDSYKINLADYHQLCVKDNLPESLKSLNGSCSNNVDLSRTDGGAFEPVGIKYMIEYWENIASLYSSKKIILYNVNGVKQKINNINNKIDELIEEEERQRLLNQNNGN